MPPKILLIMPKHREGDKTFPFGITSIYSTLREGGYDADLLDCVLTEKNLDELVTPARLRQYDIIGIGGLISCYKRVKLEVVPFIKTHAPNALIIIGGYLGTSVPELLLKNRLCDAVFLGDGEESILEFLKVYTSKSQWKNIIGLSFLDEDNQIVNTGARTLANLEEVYVPYYKHIDIFAYNSHLPENQRFYPLVVEVGCPFKCHFCFNSFGNQPRARRPEHVINEIKIAMDKYRPREIVMMAENLLTKPTWIKQFCELMDQNNLKFRWTAAGHANTINDEILTLVKNHGCYKIGIGFENFSQKILNNMNKRVTVETYVKVLTMLRRHNLEYTGTMIFGYFGEDDHTIQENIDFCKKMVFAPTYYWIQAYPRTILFNQCLEKGLIKNTEQYIEQLGDNTEYVLNLTEYSDEEVVHKRDQLHWNVAINLFNPGVYFRLIRLYGFNYLIHIGRQNINRLLRRALR